MTEHEQTRLTRRRLLLAAGGAAAAAGLASVPGCGDSEPSSAAEASVADANVDAPQLRSAPFIPSQAPPLNCNLLGFFSRDEALAVEAFTARLIPGSAEDPGAREACVTNYIDRKLAEHVTFATTTYFKEPFAKPAKGRKPGYADGTIYVSEEDLPRYGFQSSQTPQEAYRNGLANLADYAQSRYGKAFADLTEKQQDTILELLEAGKIESFQDPDGSSFFSMLQDDTNEGMFSDPLYGGNRDYAGWKLIGYPGAQRAWTEQELKTGPVGRTIQGLRDMQAMHPGRVQPNVILPIQGTRRTARTR
jgi:gluconate 2-dehydrogenase gamma chain